MRLIEELKHSPIALCAEESKQEHYEVPTEFFQYVLGRRLKYSSALFPKGTESLDLAEEEMLKSYCEKALLQDGQRVLELGCGWGSLSLYLAQKYPASQITGVSHSRTQKIYIDGKIQELGLKNLTIITAEMNSFNIDQKFDRILSIEMFEHMRNHEALLAKAAGWTFPQGLLFIHIFVHKRFTYLFEPKEENDWMARYFFTGGMMPSADLLSHYDKDFRIQQQWEVDGTHYARTARYWLENMDKNKVRILPLFALAYGEQQTQKWWNYWRVFFMSCEELWGYAQGKEWFLAHYLLKKA